MIHRGDLKKKIFLILNFCRIVSNQMKFNLRFKTNVGNGLILWTGGLGPKHRSDFLSLGLQEGELHFRFNLGGGEVDISYNETSLADGEWHEVAATRVEKRGELSVDGRSPIVRTVPGKLTQLNTNTGLFVGKSSKKKQKKQMLFK